MKFEFKLGKPFSQT